MTGVTVCAGATTYALAGLYVGEHFCPSCGKRFARSELIGRDYVLPEHAPDGIGPHALLTCWTPDEVVECIDGVSRALYRRVWRDFVPQYDGPKKYELNAFTVAAFWDQFTDAERAELNKLAASYRFAANYAPDVLPELA